ncbi:hypothetical protein [Actinotalea sp. K2]|uniref:hypothetical protein n=1 Tax=Actinotalea sp. K2 TaxID=2939438 RepID=UPI0020174365|nr:hypothetical protein [Actinotalea sp. K2]MCL3862713.1 hypothetical protein [Actinotalea sp. K2]
MSDSTARQQDAAHVGEAADPRPGRRARPGRSRHYRPWALGASIVLVALGAAIHGWVSIGSGAPVWTDDEIGVLANARVLAGVGEPWQLANLGYYPGWSVVLAPIWWMTQDPATVYRAAVTLSAVCAVAAVVPLAAIARALGARGDVSFALAAIVTLAPARTVMSNYALSENFLALMVCLTVWAALRFSDRTTAWRAVVLGLAAAYTFFSHGRTVPIVVATAAWFVWLIVRRQVRVGMVGFVTTAIGAGTGYLIYAWMTSQLYESVGGRESSAVSRMLEGTPQAIVRSVLGQSWYLSTAWAGLAILGAIAVAAAAHREIRRGRPDVATWYAFVVLGVAAISVLFIARTIARGSARLDIVAYGRYLDPFSQVLALVGLVLVVGGLSARVGLGLLAATTALSAGFLVLVVPRVPDGGWWGTINVAGLLGWPWPQHLEEWTPPWVPLALTAALLVAVLALTRRAPWLGVAAVAASFVVMSLSADRSSVARFNEINDGAAPLFGAIETLGDHPISFDRTGSDVRSQNLYQFWLGSREVEVFRSETDEPPTDVVISRADREGGVWMDAVRVEAFGSNAVWVLDGDLQDRLVASGTITRE